MQIGPGFLTLPERTAKPRITGFTHVLDKGLSLVELRSLIETAGSSIDYIKLGWGTAYVSNGVKAKVATCQSAGINLCLGGTLFEIAVHQDRLGDYVRWLHRLGIKHIEVSNGALDLPIARKRALIRGLSQEFKVISEVGSKDSSQAVVAGAWAEEMVGDLDAGASLLIAEGRESGTVGLYQADGQVREDLVEAITEAVPAGRIVFEAPRKDQQSWFIRRVGPNVNLGNIPPTEVLPLETLRLGLRADTLDLLPAVDGARATSQHADAAHHSLPLIH
ncbi:MAG: phosphosulfolactate synthase [Egibacteraceae bacterium]